MSNCQNSTAPCACNHSRFLRVPSRQRLSMITTCSPRFRQRLAALEPINPAPPVMIVFICSPFFLEWSGCPWSLLNSVSVNLFINSHGFCGDRVPRHCLHGTSCGDSKLSRRAVVPVQGTPEARTFCNVSH